MMKRFVVVLGLIMLGGMAWGQSPVPPSVDTTTQGNWVSSYGECGYALSGYNTPDPPSCQLPLLPGTGVCEPATCPVADLTCSAGDYSGGASVDITDCGDLDLSSDGFQDFYYDVYAGPYNVGARRVLQNPDGTCSDINGIWFGSPVQYQLTGVPPGDYRMAVYIMSWDSHDRRQAIDVCVNATCASPAVVDYDYFWGSYEFFDLRIAAGDVITITHNNTAAVNAVVSGLFFDASAVAPGCGNGVACYAGAGTQDQDTRGLWVGAYGADGYYIFNRVNPAIGAFGTAAEERVLIGGFAGSPGITWLWGYTFVFGTSGEECSLGDRPVGSGTAMGFNWDCAGDVRALSQPSGGCTNAQNCALTSTAVASNWNDAAERTGGMGPDLFADVEVRQPGVWELTVYAVDYDSTARRQRFHLYDWHTTTPLAPPVDIADFAGGKYVTYTLNGPFKATIRAESYAGQNAVISGIFVDPAPGHDCTGTRVDLCNLDDFCSYGHGGWGSPGHGTNPGGTRDVHWEDVYGVGGTLEVGGGNGCKALTFTSPEAIEAFMPCGGGPKAIKKNLTDPVCGKGKTGFRSTLASQITALHLNVDYSCANGFFDPSPPTICLGDLEITAGPFAGLTVSQFLVQAEQAVGCNDGEVPGLGTFSLPQFNEAATAINENFSGCSANEGFLQCAGPPTPGSLDIAVTLDASVIEDIDGNGQAPDSYPGGDVQFGLNVEAGPEDLTGATIVNTLPSFDIDGVQHDAFVVDPESIVVRPYRFLTYYPDENWNVRWDEEANQFTFRFGNLKAGAHAEVAYSARVNLLEELGERPVNSVTVEGTSAAGLTVTDTDQTPVLIVPGPSSNLAGSDLGRPGFWCNYLYEGAQQPIERAADLEWLHDINAASGWFELETLSKAQRVLCTESGKMSGLVESQLLALWFNVAAFNIWPEVQLNQLTLGNRGFCASTDTSQTVGGFIMSVEQALSSGAHNTELKCWKDSLAAINNASPPIDVDGDGFNGLQNDPVIAFDARFDGLAGDCGFADASIYPGAPENVDDGVDQDCNGADTITCFTDVDGDGHAGASTVHASDGVCDANQNEYPNSTDCNDANNAVSPTAPELCNGVDDNCDGQTDEGCL